MSAAPQIRTALLENLKELHLPAMRDCFEQTAQRAEKEPSATSNTCWSWRNGSERPGAGTASRSCCASRGCREKRRWPTST
jgi:hypothetical protein